MLKTVAEVPTSITCFFAPELRDPLNSGSVGVGITIDKVVKVSVSKGEELKIILNGEAVDFPTVEFVAKELNFKGEIRIDTEVPIGCGFGVSGASSLACAFAINDLMNLNKSFFELADVAHKAEVINRTGLGDVVTQCFGGIVVRKTASCPSRCVVDKYLWNIELDILIIDKLPTPDVLDKVKDVGKKYMKMFLKKPSVENLFKCSKMFAMESGLLDSEVKDVIEAVESEGGLASMVMIGKAVFAIKGEILKEFKGTYFKAKVKHYGIKVLRC